VYTDIAVLFNNKWPGLGFLYHTLAPIGK
jgi:hypothetical protein